MGGILAIGCLTAGTDLGGAAGFDGFSGSIKKCANSPAKTTTSTKIARPEIALIKELLNVFFLRDLLRAFLLGVVFRLAI